MPQRDAGPPLGQLPRRVAVQAQIVVRLNDEVGIRALMRERLEPRVVFDAVPVELEDLEERGLGRAGSFECAGVARVFVALLTDRTATLLPTRSLGTGIRHQEPTVAAAESAEHCRGGGHRSGKDRQATVHEGVLGRSGGDRVDGVVVREHQVSRATAMAGKTPVGAVLGDLHRRIAGRRTQ